MKKLFFLFLFPAFMTLGQVNFDNFTTLQSSGPIPSDFSSLARDKVANDDRRNVSLSEKSDEVFKQNIHYSLDYIIHSGQCIYGDPISVYIDQVAQKLLKDDKQLYSKLRFYTLKSNVSNAFSTHQGIIVFTTGLISQFANETQLAYVLAHEIMHYKEEHVVQTFEWKLQNKYNRENLNQFNNYSKEKEFEADSKAVDLCLKAGYSATEIYNSFDVLMFCHLPFDEITFPLDYFNSPLFYVPEKEYTTEVFPIKIDEAYDDENSTHPNVEKRKEVIRPALEKSFGEGSSFLDNPEEFYKIRNYARFESVRTSIMDMELSKALYQIFLLEKEFPGNYALARWKAHAWQGLLNAKLNGYWTDVTVLKRELEGESAVLHQYIKKLDKYAVASHTLRSITDALTDFPESEELRKLRTSTMKIIAASGNWSWNKYSETAFEEAFSPETELQDTVSAADTIVVETVAEPEPLSKYDRIKGTGTVKNNSSLVANDSTKYYFYGISDLMADRSFLNEFKEYEKELENKKSERSSNSKKKKTTPVIGQRLIVVEPSTAFYTKRKHDFKKTDIYQNKLINAITSVAQKENIKLYDYSTVSLNQGGTDMFNQRNAMMNYLRQYASIQEPDYFVPVDYELLQNIQQKCGTSKVLFSWTEYSSGSRGVAGSILMGVLIPPALPAMMLKSLATYRTCEISFIVMDMEQGEVQYLQSSRIHSNGGSLVLKSEVHNLFHAKK